MATLLRDYAKEQGLNVGYDPLTKNVTIGDERLAPSQLEALGGQLVNGAWTFGDTTKLGTLTGKSTTPTTVAPVTTITPTPVAPTTPSFADQLARMKEQERINTLQQSLGKTLSGLETEKAGVTPAMDIARGQARTRSTLSAQDLQNFLTQKGLGRSGAGVQGEIASNVSLQGQLGGIDVEERKQLADIERRRQQAQQEFEFDKAQAGLAYDIEALQAAENERVRQEALARENQATSEAQAREDFQNTILANYADLQGFANRLQSQGAPQWQIDQVLAARQQKIAEQGLDQQGRPLPVDTTPQLTSSSAALDLWKQLGTANEAISRALGVPVGQRYVETTRQTGGTGTTGTTSTMTPKETITFAESTLRGTSGNTSAEVMVQLNENGYFDQLTPSEIKTLMNKFGVTELMLEQAENRYNIQPTTPPYAGQGIPLPSQTGGLYGTLNTIR